MSKEHKNLKRDNWTNDEVIKLLEGLKYIETGPSPALQEIQMDHNLSIDMAKEMFYDFTRPQEEMGAMAYCPEEDMIYHIGAKLPR